jgi:hypothetical protein
MITVLWPQKKTQFKFLPPPSPSPSPSHIATDGPVCQSVSLGVEPRLGLMTRYLLLLNIPVLFSVGRPLWREDGSVFYTCYWPLPVQYFSGPGPLVLVTIFYCLNFEISLFVASYDSQGHVGNTLSRPASIASQQLAIHRQRIDPLTKIIANTWNDTLQQGVS